MCLLVCLLPSISALAGDWPQWLGPNRDGVAVGEKFSLPKDGATFPTLWKVSLGEGWAAPVVVDGKLVIHHRPGAEESIDCLDASSGKLLWRYSFASGYRDGFGMAEGPRSTPTISGWQSFCLRPPRYFELSRFRFRQAEVDRERGQAVPFATGLFRTLLFPASRREACDA